MPKSNVSHIHIVYLRCACTRNVVGSQQFWVMWVNIKTKNLSGKEAIPHIEFWRSFPDLMQEGMSRTLITSKEALRKLTGKIKGQSAAYNEI